MLVPAILDLEAQSLAGCNGKMSSPAVADTDTSDTAAGIGSTLASA